MAIQIMVLVHLFNKYMTYYIFIIVLWPDEKNGYILFNDALETSVSGMKYFTETQKPMIHLIPKYL